MVEALRYALAVPEGVHAAASEQPAGIGDAETKRIVEDALLQGSPASLPPSCETMRGATSPPSPWNMIPSVPDPFVSEHEIRTEESSQTVVEDPIPVALPGGPLAEKPVGSVVTPSVERKRTVPLLVGLGATAAVLVTTLTPWAVRGSKDAPAINTTSANAGPESVTESNPTTRAGDPLPNDGNEPAEPAPPISPALLDPKTANERAPDTFKVRFDTTRGDFFVSVTRGWAPNSADRFYNLVRIGYFQGAALYGLTKERTVAFGIHGSPQVNNAWRNARIANDPRKHPNKRGYITFNKSESGTRSVQLFVHLDNNTSLDKRGFSPFGQVSTGMNVVDSLFDDYRVSRAEEPDPAMIERFGHSYLLISFPKMDYIKHASVVADMLVTSARGSHGSADRSGPHPGALGPEETAQSGEANAAVAPGGPNVAPEPSATIDGAPASPPTPTQGGDDEHAASLGACWETSRAARLEIVGGGSAC